MRNVGFEGEVDEMNIQLSGWESEVKEERKKERDDPRIYFGGRRMSSKRIHAQSLCRSLPTSIRTVHILQ